MLHFAQTLTQPDVQQLKVTDICLLDDTHDAISNVRNFSFSFKPRCFHERKRYQLYRAAYSFYLMNVFDIFVFYTTNKCIIILHK